MVISNPFQRRSSSLPDAMLGKNYDVVKAVYNNLDVIKTFNGSIDKVEFLENKYGELSPLLSDIEGVIKISNNLTKVLSAEDSADDAKDYADLAKDWATKVDGQVGFDEYSAKYYAVQANNTYTDIQELIGDIKLLEDDVDIIYNNLDKIENIDNNLPLLNNLFDIVNGTGEEYLAPDLGMVGDIIEDDLVGNSILVTLGQNINKLNALYDHLEELVALSKTIPDLPDYSQLLSLVQRIEKTSKEIENQQKIVDKQLVLIDAKITEIRSLSGSTLDDIKAEGARQLDTLRNGLRSMEAYLNNGKSYIIQCHTAKDRCVEVLLELRDRIEDFKETVDIHTSELLKKFEETLKNMIDDVVPDEIQKHLDNALRDLHKEIADLYNEIKSKIESDRNKAISEIQTSRDLALSSINKQTNTGIISIKQTVKEANDSITLTGKTWYDNITTLGKEQQEKINQTGDNVISDVIRTSDQEKKEIDTLGDEIVDKVIQAQKDYRPVDWNATSGTHAILNKPDIYTKEEIDLKITSVFTYKGSVQSKAALPVLGNKTGDVYNVVDEGKHYIWDGTKWTPFHLDYDHSKLVPWTINPDGNGFKTIVLSQGDYISCLDMYGTYTKLISLTQSNVVSVGTSVRTLNLNSSKAIVKINGTHIVATLDDLDKLKDETLDRLKIIVSEDKPISETMKPNKLYAFHSTAPAFTGKNSEITSIILDENNEYEVKAGIGLVRYSKNILED